MWKLLFVRLGIHAKRDNQNRKGWDVFVRRITKVDKRRLRHWDRKLQVVGN
jgi:hypothetical protein